MNPTKDTPAGAKARVIDGSYFDVGDVVTLVTQDGSGCARWSRDRDSIGYYVYDRELELLEPAVERIETMKISAKPDVESEYVTGYRDGFKAARKAMKKALREVKP